MLALMLEIINQYAPHLNRATEKLQNQEAVPWNKNKLCEINADTPHKNNIT